MLNEHLWIQICEFLEPMDIINLLLALTSFLVLFSNSSILLKRFTLPIEKRSYGIISENENLLSVNFVNICIDCDSFHPQPILKLLKNYESSVENLILRNIQYCEILSFDRYDFTRLKHLTLENCKAFVVKINHLPPIRTLITISFHNCDENFFKIFKDQKNVQKLTIRSYKYDFNGFPHDEFNHMVNNFEHLNHLIFDGDGTSSYFDIGHFPFKVRILETTSVTFHWYVGLRTPRLEFLKSQLGSLKELIIHKLPSDFDGDKVLKFIIEKMQLIKFHYGKIPLILNGIKQDVLAFSATEIQVKSMFEMFRQFRTIKKLILILNNTDICSDSIENVINPRTDLFDNLEEFELIDKSEYRGLFGVFLGLYQNLTNIKKLTFDTQDRNINVILEECLPYMRNLEVICMTTTGSNTRSRFEIVRRRTSRLQKLIVPVDLVPIAEDVFKNEILIERIK